MGTIADLWLDIIFLLDRAPAGCVAAQCWRALRRHRLGNAQKSRVLCGFPHQPWGLGQCASSPSAHLLHSQWSPPITASFFWYLRKVLSASHHCSNIRVVTEACMLMSPLPMHGASKTLLRQRERCLPSTTADAMSSHHAYFRQLAELLGFCPAPAWKHACVCRMCTRTYA